MRREDELIVSSISPPPEFQDCSPHNSPCSSSRVVVIVKGSPSSSSPSSLLSTVPPPKHFRDFTPALVDEGFIYNFIKERDVVFSFADKISFNILNEAMIIATIVPEAGSSDAQRRLSISTAAVGSGQRESHYCTSSLTPSLRRISEPGNHELAQGIPITMLNSNSESETYEPAARGRDKFENPKTPSHSCVDDTKEIPHVISNDEKSTQLRSTHQHEAATSPICDAIYSLPVDNISNSTTSTTTTFSLKTSSSAKMENGSETETNCNLSGHQRTNIQSKKYGLTNPSNNINVLNTEKMAVDKNHVLPTQSKLRNSAHSALCVKMNKQHMSAEDDPMCSENNNNLSRDDIDRTSDKKSYRVQNAKSTKKKRRRTLNLSEGDCQHQENQVPGNMNGSDPRQSGNTSAIAAGRPIEKPKRTIGDALLGLFRKPRANNKGKVLSKSSDEETSKHAEPAEPFHVTTEVPHASRALPPTPCKDVDEDMLDQLHFHCEELSGPPIRSSPLEPSDIAASIEKVKDCGWYWGPLSSEAAEDLLRGEPDGSFIVRDSSDSHYIFSLTFKLNGLVRHVRIEHDHGNFSFGPMTRFKASTIVDFVEKAIAHSRSGRYLFFLHRRPVLGPMRVQLIHPYSRFRHMRSLQHMCRFAILKHVRRDLVNSLPLPNPLLEYLNAPHYYFEDKQT